MKTISFLFYYIKLLFDVSVGLHPTANPLNIKWRWKFWKQNYEFHHKRKSFQK
jgi:hypothetical protein